MQRHKGNARGLSFLLAMLCKGCQNDLGDYTRRRAFLCIMTMGDESILSWWLCDACGLYTQEEYVDRFMGDSYANVSGPFPKEVGDADVARVATCPARNDKWCECETHKHFGSN